VVAVLGSCPSRDNFKSRFYPDYKRFFSCDLATNQTSVIALMSPPYDVDDFGPPADMSEYDRWNVRSDLSREFLGLLAEHRPDYLVLDAFADVHFGVVRLPDGRYLTNNRWKLHRTGLHRELTERGGLTPLDPRRHRSEYVALFRDALARFADHLRSTSPRTRVVVHRGWNTDRVLVPGRPRPMKLARYTSIAPLDVALANEIWAELDDVCVTDHGWDAIDLRAERCPTSAEHPWGPFWVHYTPDYYHRFLAELHKIHLRHHPEDPQLLDRLAAIEAAAAEPARRELAVERAVVAHLRERNRQSRERLDRLEAGRWRAARRIVSRRLAGDRRRNRPEERS
jgi:hypothetical protein